MRTPTFTDIAISCCVACLVKSLSNRDLFSFIVLAIVVKMKNRASMRSHVCLSVANTDGSRAEDSVQSVRSVARTE